MPSRASNEEFLVRARQIREGLKAHSFTAADIQKAVDDGRP
ncbi:hypothetical protein [Ectothiorhodospira haloalkaliphila]|nr:hypothetical protein [Ectothiorhodospira haloalkaliphila]